MRDKLGSAFTLSPDAASVRFGVGYGEEQPVLFGLAAASLTDSPSLRAGYLTAKVDGLPVTDWRNDYAPKFNGVKLALDAYEESRALAVRPGASGFALGTDYWVRAYGAKGTERWSRPPRTSARIAEGQTALPMFSMMTSTPRFPVISMIRSTIDDPPWS